MSLNVRCEVGDRCRIVCVSLTYVTKASSMCTWKEASTMVSFGRSLPLEFFFD